jgi:hypothetical protein
MRDGRSEQMRTNWEYCMLMQGESVGKRLGLGGGALVFRRFGLEGYVQNSRIGSGDDEELLAKTVALLGKNGWELVSVSGELQPGVSFSGARWVFKRPMVSTAAPAVPETEGASAAADEPALGVDADEPQGHLDDGAGSGTQA